MNRFIVAQGRATFAMVTLLIGCGVNFVLDPLFIYGFEWGVEGAAWATIIAWMVTAVWVLSFFVRKKGVVHLKFKGVQAKPTDALSIVSIGIAPFSLQIVGSLTSSLFNNSLRDFGGAMAISAMGAIQSVLQFFQMPLYGLNHGSQPIIGFNYGAKNYARVRATLRIVIIVGTIVGTLGFAVAMSIPRLLVGIFGSNPDLLAIGSRSMRIFLMCFPVVGILIQGSQFFSSTGRPQFAMLITLSKQAMLVPGLLLLPRVLKLDGVFAAAPVSDAIAIMIGATLIIREWRRLKRLEAVGVPQTT